MDIVLFALIGAAIHAKASYWICFGIYCFVKVIKLLYENFEENK